MYEERGVFEKAERMVEKCRSRALEQAEGMGDEALRELLRLVARTVL
jgi:hypothetical protein